MAAAIQGSPQAFRTTQFNSATHTCLLPDGIQVGELLLIFTSVDGGSTITPPSGWDTVVSEAIGGQVQLRVFSRIVDGTEGFAGTGDSVTYTTGDNQLGVFVSVRIADDDSTANPPEATATPGTSATPDPPSLTPTGGSAEYLWFAVAGWDSNPTADSVPTDYTSVASFVHANAAGTGISVAQRTLTATSQDPDTFGIGASEQWGAATVAIYPVAAGGSTVAVAAVLPTLGAAATVEASSDVQAAGVLPTLDAAASVDAQSDVAADGVLPSLDASASVEGSSDLTVSGDLPALAASASLDSGSDLAIAASLPGLEASASLDASSDVGVVGDLPVLELSANITADTALVQVTAVLPGLEAQADVASSSDTEVTGVLPGLEASADITVEIPTVTVDGQLPGIEASATITASADSEVAGTLPEITANVGLDATSDLAYDGTLPALGAAASVTVGDFIGLNVAFILPEIVAAAAIGPPPPFSDPADYATHGELGGTLAGCRLHFDAGERYCDICHAAWLATRIDLYAFTPKAFRADPRPRDTVGELPAMPLRRET